MQRKARPSFEFVKQGVFQRQAERQRLTVRAVPLHGIDLPVGVFCQWVLCMGQDLHLEVPKLGGCALLCIHCLSTVTVLVAHYVSTEAL